MSRQERNVRGGAKLREIRKRLGFSVRDVERISHEMARNRSNPFLALSRTWIADVETGRFVPGSFKMASLAEIFGMEVFEIHKLYGLPPDVDITQQQPAYRPPRTQLLTPRIERVGNTDSTETVPPEPLDIEKTNLLAGIADIWGNVPVPLRHRFGRGRYLYGFIGTEDRSLGPVLPPGSFVQIDTSQTRIRKGPFPKSWSDSHFARPIYFLDIRTGYACGYCELKDGILTLIPHPDSGEAIRTFKYPSEVSVIGRVAVITRSIEEERFGPSDDGKEPRPKK